MLFSLSNVASRLCRYAASAANHNFKSLDNSGAMRGVRVSDDVAVPQLIARHPQGATDIETKTRGICDENQLCFLLSRFYLRCGGYGGWVEVC